jgi:hypothetical protein
LSVDFKFVNNFKKQRTLQTKVQDFLT